MGFIFCATIHTVLYQLFLKLEYFHSCECVFPSGAILIINNALLSKGRVRKACLALSRKSMSSLHCLIPWDGPAEGYSDVYLFLHRKRAVKGNRKSPDLNQENIFHRNNDI